METGQNENSSWYGQAYALTDLEGSNPNIGDFSDPDKRPKWAVKVLIELMSQGMPAISLKKLRVITPDKVGRFWGQKFAILYAFGGKARMQKVPEEIEKAIAYWEKKKDEPNASTALNGLNFARQMVTEAGNVGPIEENLLQAFKLALNQPNHQEAVEFFRGFALGLSKKGITSKGLALETDATPIYKMMLAHWQEVDRLASVPILRKFLISHGLTESTVGDISRLRRLCTRIGYAPGKRGRPANPK